MKEIKFNSMAEVYAWAATGKPIKCNIRLFNLNTNGNYKDRDGHGLSFASYYTEYTGIEETPVKKLYAYRYIGAYAKGKSRIDWFEHEIADSHFERASGWDKTFPEKREE